MQQQHTIQIHFVGTYCIEHSTTCCMNKSVGASTCLLTKLSATLPSFVIPGWCKGMHTRRARAAGCGPRRDYGALRCVVHTQVFAGLQGRERRDCEGQHCCTSFNSAVCIAPERGSPFVSLTLFRFRRVISLSRDPCDPCRISQLLFALVESAVVPLLLQAFRAEKAPTSPMSEQRVK